MQHGTRPGAAAPPPPPPQPLDAPRRRLRRLPSRRDFPVDPVGVAAFVFRWAWLRADGVTLGDVTSVVTLRHGSGRRSVSDWNWKDSDVNLRAL